MLLKKYYPEYLLVIAFTLLFFQSCHTTSKTQVISKVVIPVRDTTPVEKLASKTSTIIQPEKEDVKLTANQNENVLSAALYKKYADLLEVKPRDLTNEKLYKLIDEWWHAPYKYAGNNKSGIDCSGFSCMVLKTVFNQEIIRGSASMYQVTNRVKKEDLKEGDLVFFRIRRGRVSHVGVYLINNKFVHASVKYGVTISSLDDPYYKKVFTSGGRVGR